MSLKMSTIKSFDSFDESKNPLEAAKVILSSYIKKSDWINIQSKQVKDLIKKLAGQEVKVLNKVEDKSVYVVQTGDNDMPSIEIPERFLLS